MKLSPRAIWSQHFETRSLQFGILSCRRATKLVFRSSEYWQLPWTSHWSSRGKRWRWPLGELIAFLLQPWGVRTLSGCGVAGCDAGCRRHLELGNRAGLGSYSGGDSERQVGRMLEDACIVTFVQKSLFPGRELPYFFHNFSYKQPAWNGAWKCRESWAFSFLVVHSFFILALEKGQSSGLFSSSQPRQTSLMETGSLQKKNVEGVGLFSLPFILLEKRKWRTGNETGISSPD